MSASDADSSASVGLRFDPTAPLPPPPQLAISPSAGIIDGQRVVARGSGLRPGGFAGIRQCVTALPSSAGCDRETNVGGVVDANGVFAKEFVAIRHVVTESGVTDCAARAGACNLRLFFEDGEVATAMPFSLLPAVQVSSPSVTEGDGGTTVARVVVSISKPSSRSVAVAFRTSDFTAKSPGDYTAKSGVLVYNPGQTSKTIDIVVSADNVTEGSERFLVYFSRFVNARSIDVSPKTVVTILDDD
jgi:hypothetical protein